MFDRLTQEGHHTSMVPRDDDKIELDLKPASSPWISSINSVIKYY